MNTTSASERDAGTAQADAAVDAGLDAAVPDDVDAGVSPPQHPAADSGARHAAVGGSGAQPAATGGGTSGGGRGGAGAGGQAATAAGAAAPEPDPKTFAAGLSELFIDMPCDAATPTPLAVGIACSHPANGQNAEKVVTFGGKAGTRYSVTLRVRAIFEPTDIEGGVQPNPSIPFTVGGNVAQNPDGTPTNAINYQRFAIQVAEPAQTYWLNNYHMAAHEIHKEDYEASLDVAGGAEIKVVVQDGNDLEISNFSQLLFTDFPPYDKMPSLGQSLRLDVVSVEARP